VQWGIILRGIVRALCCWWRVSARLKAQHAWGGAQTVSGVGRVGKVLAYKWGRKCFLCFGALFQCTQLRGGDLCAVKVGREQFIEIAQSAARKFAGKVRRVACEFFNFNQRPSTCTSLCDWSGGPPIVRTVPYAQWLALVRVCQFRTLIVPARIRRPPADSPNLCTKSPKLARICAQSRSL